jgi:hypothetical protein
LLGRPLVGDLVPSRFGSVGDGDRIGEAPRLSVGFGKFELAYTRTFQNSALKHKHLKFTQTFEHGRKTKIPYTFIQIASGGSPGTHTYTHVHAHAIIQILKS